MSFDSLFFKQYNSKTYNCRHFFNDAWELLTGEKNKIPEVITNDIRKTHKRTKTPISPCLCLFAAKDYTHVGVYYKDKILHITKSGVKFEPLEVAKVNFSAVRFYI